MRDAPPIRWADIATRRDLDHLAERLDRKLDSLENRLRAEFHAGLRSNLLSIVAANAATAVLVVAALKLG